MQEVTGSNPVAFHYPFGGVAQLEERLICTQEVTGSNPVAFHYKFGPVV